MTPRVLYESFTLSLAPFYLDPSHKIITQSWSQSLTTMSPLGMRATPSQPHSPRMGACRPLPSSSDLASSLASSELQLSTGELVQFVHDCAAANALNFSSMHQDVKYGRRTEAEYLNGWIARKSLEVGLPRKKSWLGRNEELAQAIMKRRSG